MKNGDILTGWHETLNQKAFLECRAAAITYYSCFSENKNLGHFGVSLVLLFFLPFSTNPSVWLGFI